MQEKTAKVLGVGVATVMALGAIAIVTRGHARREDALTRAVAAFDTAEAYARDKPKDCVRAVDAYEKGVRHGLDVLRYSVNTVPGIVPARMEDAKNAVFRHCKKEMKKRWP